MFAPERITDPVSDPLQRVTVCFAEMRGGTTIELVEPLGENSPVDAIIGSSRGGIYHLCFEADDLDAELARFRGTRCVPLGKPVPAVAFRGRRIAVPPTPRPGLLPIVEAPPS